MRKIDDINKINYKNYDGIEIDISTDVSNIFNPSNIKIFGQTGINIDSNDTLDSSQPGSSFHNDTLYTNHNKIKNKKKL